MIGSESRSSGGQNAKLIDLLDRVLDKGVAISGDIVISVGGVDLLYLDIRILAGSLETILRLHDSISKGTQPILPTKTDNTKTPSA